MEKFFYDPNKKVKKFVICRNHLVYKAEYLNHGFLFLHDIDQIRGCRNAEVYLGYGHEDKKIMVEKIKFFGYWPIFKINRNLDIIPVDAWRESP